MIGYLSGAWVGVTALVTLALVPIARMLYNYLMEKHDVR